MDGSWKKFLALLSWALFGLWYSLYFLVIYIAIIGEKITIGEPKETFGGFIELLRLEVRIYKPK